MDNGSQDSKVRSAILKLVQAWNAMGAHNLYFMEHTPMGEPYFTKWREEAIPLVDEVQRHIGIVRDLGYEVYIERGSSQMHVLPRGSN